jgi:hypothetical protein
VCWISTKKLQVLVINLEKSQFFFFNTSIPVQRHISKILGFQKASIPSKYLGAPLLDKAAQNSTWQELLEKLETKLTNWTHRFLTLPGRILLIKSVLSSMPLYLFSVLANSERNTEKYQDPAEVLPMGRGYKREKMGLSSLG